VHIAGGACPVALGADYDMDATPGLAETGDEFYSVEGAVRMRDAIRGFSKGRVVVGVCGAPFKCPPAPSECALLLHDDLVSRGIRGDCEITLVLPFGRPVPPSPEASAALISAFEEHDIRLVSSSKVSSLDLERKVVVLDDGSELPYDLFLGVPKHRAPEVVLQSGLTEDGYVPVDPATLETHVLTGYASVTSIAAAPGWMASVSRRCSSVVRTISLARAKLSSTSGTGLARPPLA
jgi:sulfide:quinone oxidoreductase